LDDQQFEDLREHFAAFYEEGFYERD